MAQQNTTEVRTAEELTDLAEGDQITLLYESKYAERGNEQEMTGTVTRAHWTLQPETDDGYACGTLYVDTEDGERKISVDCTPEGQPSSTVKTPRRGHDTKTARGGLTSRTSHWTTISTGRGTLLVAEDEDEAEAQEQEAEDSEDEQDDEAEDRTQALALTVVEDTLNAWQDLVERGLAQQHFGHRSVTGSLDPHEDTAIVDMHPCLGALNAHGLGEDPHDGLPEAASVERLAEDLAQVNRILNEAAAPLDEARELADLLAEREGEDDEDEAERVECSRCGGTGERGPGIVDPDECEACEGTGRTEAQEARTEDGERVQEGDTVTVRSGSLEERVAEVHADGRVRLDDGRSLPASHLHLAEDDEGEDEQPETDGGRRVACDGGQVQREAEDAGLGDVLVLDCRVFHRCGLDGTHHVEQGVEYVLMDDPADGPAAAVLTVEQEQALDPSIAGVLHDLRLDVAGGQEAVEAHPMVAALQEVRQG